MSGLSGRRYTEYNFILNFEESSHCTSLLDSRQKHMKFLMVTCTPKYTAWTTAFILGISIFVWWYFTGFIFISLSSAIFNISMLTCHQFSKPGAQITRSFNNTGLLAFLLLIFKNLENWEQILSWVCDCKTNIFSSIRTIFFFFFYNLQWLSHNRFCFSVLGLC